MKNTLIASAIALLYSQAAFAETLNVQTDDVVVTASRITQQKSNTIGDVTVINREEIEQTSATSILDLLQMQSGIEISSNGGLGKTASIRIRGANDNNTIVLIDGVRANSATLGTTSFQHIPLSQIEKIEILRGPSSSLYGSEGIGGVVQIFTRQSSGAPSFNFSATTGSYNTQDVSAGVSGKVNATTFSLQAGYTTSDGFSATNNKDQFNYYPDHDGYKNKNISAKIAYEIDEKNEIGATLFHANAINHYDSSFTDASFNSIYQSYDYRENQLLTAISIYSKNQLTDWWSSTLKFGRGIDDLKLYDPNSTNTDTVVTGFKTTQNQYTWQNDFKLPIGRLSLSLEKLAQEVDGTTAYAVKKRDIDSVFAGWVASIGKNDLQLNLRSDDNSQFGQYTTWFAGYGYHFADHWKTSISHGTAFNAPTFNQLYYPLDSSGSSGNPNLKAEESENTEMSLHFNNSNRSTSLTAYHNKVENLIDWKFNPATSAFSPENISNATLEGVSLNDAEYWGNWIIKGNLDVQDPKNDTTEKLLPRRSQRHGNLGVLYKYEKWTFGANVFAESLRYDSNGKKLTGYSTLNLSAAYRIDNEWSIKGTINNLLNKDYELAYGFNTPGANAYLSINYTPSN